MADKKKKTKTVVAYYCEDRPNEYCMKWKGSGDIWITKQGRLRVITIEIPAVCETEKGYTEFNNVFLYKDPMNNDKDRGLIGASHCYKDEASEFFVTEYEDTQVFNNYQEWESHLP